MNRLLVSVVALVAMAHCGGARAVSFGVEGQPVAYEQGNQLCFRVERYIYSHSVISFLNWTRDIEARDVRLLDALVGREGTQWGVAYEGDPSSGLRLRRSTGVCYGVAPAGFVTTDEAEPLTAGRYTILMNASEGKDNLRFTDDFCLSADGHVIKCDEGEEPPRSFLERLFRWIFGD